MNRIVLVDGKNALYRHHFANSHLSSDDGFPTGALHGCLKSIIMMAKRLKDTPFVFIWDGQGPTWRHQLIEKQRSLFDQFNTTTAAKARSELESPVDEMVASSLSFLGLSRDKPKRQRVVHKVGYKANRGTVSAAEDKDTPKKKSEYPTEPKARALIQLPIMQAILKCAGFHNLEVRGLEGDDLMAIVAYMLMKTKDTEVIIHSGDKDFYQCLAWPRTKILQRIEDGKLRWVTPEEVEGKYGVHPREWTKYRALTGDSSDNIPHLYKVGPKTAVKMLREGLDPSVIDYRTIDRDVRDEYARYFEPHGIANMWNAVYGSYRLCKLVTDHQDSCLSESVRLQLKEMFLHYGGVEDFERTKDGRTSDAFRRVSFMLMQYQLSEVKGRQTELWAIP